jgi:hypothetical protein
MIGSNQEKRKEKKEKKFWIFFFSSSSFSFQCLILFWRPPKFQNVNVMDGLTNL